MTFGPQPCVSNCRSASSWSDHPVAVACSRYRLYLFSLLALDEVCLVAEFVRIRLAPRSLQSLTTSATYGEFGDNRGAGR